MAPASGDPSDSAVTNSGPGGRVVPMRRLNALLFGDRVVISTTRPEYLSLAEVIVAGR